MSTFCVLDTLRISSHLGLIIKLKNENITPVFTADMVRVSSSMPILQMKELRLREIIFPR